MLPYTPIPELDPTLYTDYFLNEFIPKHGSIEAIQTVPNKFYMIDFLNDPEYNSDSTIKFLENTLIEKFNFPKIRYLMIFHHIFNQVAHIDGTKVIRNASLNLPIHGFQGTNTTWYDLSSPLESYFIQSKDFDRLKFPDSDLTPATVLPADNSWNLINTAIPHRIVNENYNNPRITLCVRFVDNPTYSFLSGLITK